MEPGVGDWAKEKLSLDGLPNAVYRIDDIWTGSPGDLLADTTFYCLSNRYVSGKTTRWLRQLVKIEPQEANEMITTWMLSG